MKNESLIQIIGVRKNEPIKVRNAAQLAGRKKKLKNNSVTRLRK